MKRLVLVAGFFLIVPWGVGDSTALLNERRLSTLEEQRRNQLDYNSSFDKEMNDKIDNNQRMVQEHFAAIERSQGEQDAKLQSLRDTQNIALFLAGLTPLALGWFYFKKSAADHARNDAILATENRIKSLEEGERREHG